MALFVILRNLKLKHHSAVSLAVRFALLPSVHLFQIVPNCRVRIVCAMYVKPAMEAGHSRSRNREHSRGMVRPVLDTDKKTAIACHCFVYTAGSYSVLVSPGLWPRLLRCPKDSAVPSHPSGIRQPWACLCLSLPYLGNATITATTTNNTNEPRRQQSNTSFPPANNCHSSCLG